MMLRTRSVTLTSDLRSVGKARRFTSRMCTAESVSDGMRDTAVFLTSETVTNALTHGNGEARLTVIIASSGVRIEVGDDSDNQPTIHPEDLDDIHGRGMFLLDAMASSWGVKDERHGKLLWFEVDGTVPQRRIERADLLVQPSPVAT